MATRSDWTLRQRFVHWRLRAARDAVRMATMRRYSRPDLLIVAKSREDLWTRRWIATFRKAASS